MMYCLMIALLYYTVLILLCIEQVRLIQEKLDTFKEALSSQQNRRTQ